MNPAVANAAAAGGEMFTVRYKSGTDETVVVRSVPWSKMDEYLSLQGNETALAELLCDRRKGWGDTLELESLCDLVEKGEQVNDPNFFRLAERRRKRLASMEDRLKERDAALANGSPK